jgi:hypothetical protein
METQKRLFYMQLFQHYMTCCEGGRICHNAETSQGRGQGAYSIREGLPCETWLVRDRPTRDMVLVVENLLSDGTASRDGMTHKPDYSVQIGLERELGLLLHKFIAFARSVASCIIFTGLRTFLIVVGFVLPWFFIVFVGHHQKELPNSHSSLSSIHIADSP